MPNPAAFWLFKSEPTSYSLTDLARDGRSGWEGVRNYQARNYLRDEVAVGDGVLFYHSNAEPAGVAGIARVVRAGFPDPSARDPQSPYYDPKASEAEPRWYQVELEFAEAFPRLVPLAALRATPGLEAMPLLNRSRLSVQPVTAEQFAIIAALGRTAS